MYVRQTVAVYHVLPAVTNVGIGLAIFSQRLSRFQDLTILYVYLGYLGFFLAIVLGLFMLYTIIAYTSGDEGEGEVRGGTRGNLCVFPRSRQARSVAGEASGIWQYQHRGR